MHETDTICALALHTDGCHLLCQARHHGQTRCHGDTARPGLYHGPVLASVLVPTEWAE